MARALLNQLEAVRTGLLLGAAGVEQAGDAANGHYFVAGPGIAVIARNTGAGARTVTAKRARTVDGVAPVDNAVALAAGVSRMFGPYREADGYIQPDGSVNIDVEHAEIKLQLVHIQS